MPHHEEPHDHMRIGAALRMAFRPVFGDFQSAEPPNSKTDAEAAIAKMQGAAQLLKEVVAGETAKRDAEPDPLKDALERLSEKISAAHN